MNFKAIIFDLDGTLLDTLEDLAESMNRTLQQMGFAIHPVEKYRYFVGEGIEILCKNVIPDGKHSKDIIRKCVALMRAEYGRHWADKTKVYEGIPELLDKLAARQIKTAVLSNKPDDFTRSIVSRLLGRWEFGIVMGERRGIPRKPAPDGAIEISKILRMRPEEIVYVGDTGIDMQTASAAGMYPVGASWGFRTAEELNACGAAKIIANPPDLLTLL